MRTPISALILLCFFISAEVLAEPLKIGVSVPLTGSAATLGTDIKNALTFANERYGNHEYELVFEDDKCSGKEAVTIAQKFVQIDKIHFVLGFPCSGALLSAAPVYEQNRVVVIAAAASSPCRAASYASSRPAR